MNINEMIENIAFPKIVARGLDYYLEDNVVSSSIDYYANGVINIEGEVKGSRRKNYEVDITVNSGAVHYDCTCPYDYGGACKHVVAVLYSINDKLLKEEEKKKEETLLDKSQKKSDENIELEEEVFFQLLSMFNDEENENKIKLIANADFIHDIWSGEGLEFKFKLRDADKEIPIENLSRFSKAYINNYQYIYRNKVIYDPDYDNFSYQTKMYLEKVVGFFEKNRIGKSVEFSMEDGFNFIESMLENEIELYVKGEKFDKNRKFKLPFNIKKYNHKLRLEISGRDFRLSHNFISFNESIYWINHKEKDFIRSMLGFFEQNSWIEISDANRGKTGELLKKFSSNIEFVSKNQELIGIEKIKMKFYFDKDKENSVLCNIKCFDKDKEIDVFNKKIKIHGKEDVLNEIERYLLRNGFKGENGGYQLKDDEEIYDFMSKDLKILKRRGDVYFSEKFEKLEINTNFKIDSAIDYLGHEKLININFSLNGIEEVELKTLLDNYKRKVKFYRLKDGSFLDLRNKKMEKLVETMELFDKNDIQNMNFPQTSLLYLNKKIKELKLGKVQQNRELKEYIKSFKAKPDFELSDYYKKLLREYQKDGVEWLAKLSKFNFGGILADDMGLGKTLQILAFINSLESCGTSLVVVPKSLLYNWTREIAKFADNLDYISIDGSKTERKNLISKIDKQRVVLTSYSLLRQDIDLYENLEFEYMFIDEAQHIKNPIAKLTKAVKKISAEKRFAMTGTPVENKLEELWSIFDFIMPSYLHSLGQFQDNYGTLNKEKLTDLKFRVEPFIIRRTKSEVLTELPDKLETEVFVELDKKEKTLYRSFVDEFYKEYDDKTSKLQILTVLLKLRQICCHSKLLDEKYIGKSSKQDALEELVNDALDGGHRILVFSQFTSMLKILEKSLNRQKINTFYLDGKTPAKKRLDLVDKFNAGDGDVFLISLKAGGTGLNLIGADTVIHYDPWWNPAVENQASDRAYRMGQTKNVQVIKLLTKGTIEEKIFKIQKNKQKLVDSVLNVDAKRDILEEDLMKLLEIE